MVTAEYMPEVFGGAEQQCHRLSGALVRKGLAVTVLTSAVDRTLPPVEWRDGVCLRRLRSRHSPQRGGRHILASLWWSFRVVSWIWRHRRTIDVVHAHQAKINAVAAVAGARLAGLPSLVKVGSAGERKFDFYSLERKRPLVGPLFARFVRDRADRIVAISRDLVTQLEAYGVPRHRIVQIPNGIALPVLDEALAERAAWRNRLELADSDLCMAFVGRLAADKNLEVLLDAMALAVREAAHLRLVLVGDGPLRASLEARARTLGLASRVAFAGRTDCVDGYLCASDLFVLPALAEGMSNALLEAMSLALPVVASNVSGNVDLVEHERSGWLFEPASARELAGLMVRAATTSSHRLREMGMAGRHLVETHHEIGLIATRYASLYEVLSPTREGDRQHPP